MESGGRRPEPAGRLMTYCVVPRSLAAKLYEPLRHHFRADPDVEVIVERRAADRRASQERRSEGDARGGLRRIRNSRGRRIAERRATTADVRLPPLPRRAQRHAGELVFVERLEPSGQHAEDVDTARVVTQFQAGDEEAFGILYMRYFDRVYMYMRVVLEDAHAAEDATQQIFTKVLESLSRYEHRSGHPFRAWLFVVVRNHAITERKLRQRYDVVDPETLSSDVASHEDVSATLDWVMDRELMMFVNRLPLAQRQVLVLRYVLDFSDRQIAEAIGTNATHVRVLQARALKVLNDRLTAIGRAPSKSVKRAGWLRRIPQAPVLRQRRFSLSP